MGVTIFAIAGLTAWQVEDIRVVREGEPFDVSSYTLTLERVAQVPGPNYLSTMGFVRLERGGRELSVLHPEKRAYLASQMPTTEAGIDNGFLRDVYVVVGDPQNDGGWAMRVYIKPLANWIWGGCILMAIGGLLSLSDRRFRVAAGARKRRAQGVPAE
jgi:cytochrome c-type biogenesis protein CcmF